MKPPDFSVARILEGFEFGHGQISGLAAQRAVLAKVDETVHHNPAILVLIDNDEAGRPLEDDGCGDGRGVLKVFSLEREYKRSLNRSKVFGGAATMAMAAAVGLGTAKDASLNNLFATVIRDLTARQIDFGAHTDEHVHGDNCGCGAIDNAPQILLAVLKYEIPIRGVVTYFTKQLESLDEVYGNFRRYAAVLARHPAYSGKQVMDTILNSDRSRVVKQLGGEHKECRIILNTIRGYTVNQQLIRDVTDNAAQVFAVDVWRMEDIASSLYPAPDGAAHKAFLSELIYTIATAAVLTKGDLPVDVIAPAAGTE